MTSTSTVGYTGFPAFSQLHCSGSLLTGATSGHDTRVHYLRTVIVPELPISLWGVDHIFIRRLQRRSSAYGL